MNRSLTDFLRTAMEPVGSTMYIWGGGWNSEDNGSGEDAKIIGVNPNWKKFFISQGSDYDYKEHRYEHGNGLDCSGYVGWVMYNIFENTRVNYLPKWVLVNTQKNSRGSNPAI